MLRDALRRLAGVFRRFAARFGVGEESGDGRADDGETNEEADDGNAADSRFVPSVLDASVRYAHGMRDTGVEREIAAIEEEARRLEELQRDDR